ncbi:MAG: FAD:protein FMN transferase [Lachnospiraceae bacterium]|nr:FAD:protein FMN transferase [Lachnospiraceae bacterium]
MKSNSKALLLITFIYIYLPVCIFMIGHTKIAVWIITLSFCAFFMKKMYEDYTGELENTEPVKIGPWMMALSALILIVICILIGFGGIFQQAGDWHKHNAVLRDLVNRSWPVYYERYEKSMLTYYLGQYMLPALIGKAVRGLVMARNGGMETDIGFKVASAVMAVWGVTGLYLVYLNLVRITKSDNVKKQFRTLFIMLLFCGALPLAQLVCNDLYSVDMFSLGAHHWLLVEDFMLQYRSNIVMIRWVYPQVIVIWLIVMLFMEHKKHTEHYVLLFAPALLYGTFSIVCFACLGIAVAVQSFIKAEDKKKSLFKIFSLSNICTMATLGTVLITYFLGYMQVEKPRYMKFHVQDMDLGTVWIIFIFDFMMFGIYAICTFKEHKKDIIYYTTVAVLTVIPVFRMGLCNDWVMGTSIPGLFVIMIFVIELFNTYDRRVKSEDVDRKLVVRATVTAVVLVIGMWYPLMEIKDNIKVYKTESHLQDVYGSLEFYSNRDAELSEDMLYNYYTYEPEDKFFYKYLAARKMKSDTNAETDEKKDSVSGFYFDTYVNIRVFDDTNGIILDDALEKCAEYERIFSRTDPESELYKINSRQGNLNTDEDGAYMTDISEDMYSVICLGREYADSTSGCFDIAIGNVSELWDFHAEDPKVPDKESIEKALLNSGTDGIMVDKTGDGKCFLILEDDAKLDLGGIAKGYIADKLKDFLVSEGCKEAVISLGGNVVCIGDKNGEGYIVGVQKPFGDLGETIDTVNIADCSVVTSGIYERYFEIDDKIYHHVIDPKTGYPVENDLAGVTVICEDSAKADALSTALLIMGSDEAMNYINRQANDVSAILVRRDGSIVKFNV